MGIDRLVSHREDQGVIRYSLSPKA